MDFSGKAQHATKPLPEHLSKSMSEDARDDFTSRLHEFFQRHEKISLPALSLLHPGDRCPACGKGELVYNGMLDLVCRQCGAVNSTIGACT